MTLFPIFCSFIAEELLNIDNSEIEKYCLNLKQIDGGRKVSNQGGYQSNLISKIDRSLDELYNILLEKIKTTNLQLGYKDITPVLKSMWININSENTYNLTHDHPDSFYSAVYYAKAALNQGDILFYHPITFISNYFIVNKIANYGNFNSLIWTCKPTTGVLLIFPSYLSHCVTGNNTKEDRISIAFNFGVK